MEWNTCDRWHFPRILTVNAAARLVRFSLVVATLNVVPSCGGKYTVRG